MKEKAYTDIICKGFCLYYKEGKEDILCGSYRSLRKNLTTEELLLITGPSGKIRDWKPLKENISAALDNEIMRTACSKCNFLVDGCDFRDNRSGPPCGGYVVLHSLLK